MSLLKVNEVTDLGGGVPEGVGGFNASTTITATDATWTVPALGSPIVKVTVVAGGGGGGANQSNGGANGGTSSFACSAGTVSATGGLGGFSGQANSEGRDSQDYLCSGNFGGGAPHRAGGEFGTEGLGGQVTVGYLDMSGISTANVTVGAGGVGGSAGLRRGGNGGNGVVIFEYVAG